MESDFDLCADSLFFAQDFQLEKEKILSFKENELKSSRFKKSGF